MVTEATHNAEFILSDDEKLSREILVCTADNLVAGSVLGKVTASGKYKLHDQDAIDGTEVAAGILVNAVDASAADADGLVITYHAAVAGDRLTWQPDIIAAEKTTAIGELWANHKIRVL